MAGFAVDLHDTADTTNATGAIYCPGSGQRRARIYDLIFGCEGAPADAAFRWDVQRSTTAPTGDAVTLQALDPGAGTFVTLAAENMSANGTQTAGAFLLSVALHQRATFRWVAVPGRELVIPATANNGLHIIPAVSSALAVTVTAHGEEE